MTGVGGGAAGCWAVYACQLHQGPTLFLRFSIVPEQHACIAVSKGLSWYLRSPVSVLNKRTISHQRMRGPREGGLSLDRHHVWLVERNLLEFQTHLWRHLKISRTPALLHLQQPIDSLSQFLTCQSGLPPSDSLTQVHFASPGQ